MLSCDYVHMFVEIPPHISVSDVVPRGDRPARSSRSSNTSVNDTGGQRFWGRGYFSTTSGNITDDIIMRYLNRHSHKKWLQPLQLILPASAGLSFRELSVVRRAG